MDEAGRIAKEDVAINTAIGWHGAALLRAPYERNRPGGRLNVLSRYNAGLRRSIGARHWRRSTAPTMSGVPIHVWVDETRPRIQGALTGRELAAHGVPHTVIVDNVGGHLMQHRQVDPLHRWHRPHHAPRRCR